ncbi:MAG: T9SS type A sorting domain-containing protein [Candidatus Cloacimonetes bacterium]|nr:T9SS type A sorting domain-containing protein [Candidatus Cloacimonadota bacterium]
MKHLLLTLILMAALIALAADVVYSYTLGEPVVKTSAQYTSLHLQGAQSWGNPGQPDLPWFGTKILLPQGEEAVDIEVELSEPRSLALTLPIMPLQEQLPLSQTVIQPPTEPDPAVYLNDSVFPAFPHNGPNTQFLAGHPINFTAVCPFRYNPVTNELIFYRQIRINVRTNSTERAAASLKFLRENTATREYLGKAVDNAVETQRYDTRTSGWEYLIIHDEAKLEQWIPFQAIYQQRGMNVLMKSVQEITAQISGTDTQDKIRNYIIGVYESNPLRHVLLAGDTDLIPHRGFYVNMGSGGESDADIPADMYYSCLDGNWNTDGDANWGEYMEADFVPELSVGRFCYNSDTEIASFINKTNSYLNQPVIAEGATALFVGEWLWEGPTWGGDYMDEMIGGSSAHGYTTVGVPTTWNITTLYDRTFNAAESWNGSQLLPLLSNGPNLVNHLGHSATTYCMRLSNNSVTEANITNNGIDHNFSVIFSQGCYAGAFDNRGTNPGQYGEDCITERFTSISTAAVAMLAHSRYGWGTQGSTDGASQHIHREYVDAIFGENIRELGYTLVDSKVDNIPFIQNSPVMYWVTYETNLIGDPGLMVWGDTPHEMSVQLPGYWNVGLNDYQVQTNAPGSLLRLKNGNEILCEAAADEAGLISIQLVENLTPGDMEISIIASDFIAYHNVVTVQASDQPYIVASQVQFLDADGLYHTGETIGLNVTLKNVGFQNQSEPGTISLVSNSPNLSVLSGSHSFDPLAAADSTQINDFFQFKIQGNYPDRQIAYLNFEASFDTYISSTPVALILNAPYLHLDTYQFVNSNPQVLPGDSPQMNLIVSNSGSGYAQTPLLILFADDPYITISATEALLPPIEPDNFTLCENVFSLLVSPDAPIGSSINVGYMLGAENGNTLEGNFVLYIGNQHYTFETDAMGWNSLAPLSNYLNQWHRESSRNNTPGGTWSMKFGGSGSTQYSGSAYGALDSPEIPLGTNGRLYFHHWMDAERHDNQIQAWDGGLVQISIDGGPWTQITPVGGYPYRIYTNSASPFAGNTYVYSGSFGWTQAEFDLSAYTGMARFRFLFGSDAYVGGEGWYIDDLYAESDFTTLSDDPVQTLRFDLADNYPNPFNPSTTIGFNLPAASAARLDIFNLRGQRVCTLVDGELPAGTHSAVWNGQDSSGDPVSSGVYLYRLSNGTDVLTRKMMLMK